MNTSDLIFWIYLALGPTAWVLMFMGLFLGLSRMMRLKHSKLAVPANPPKVTIFIPAKDEAAEIRRCLEGVLDQDYPNFGVIVIDDRSSDDTGQILDTLAQTNPKLRVVHISPGGLPSGWLGKCNALFTASRLETSPWFLFVDSDVTLTPNALTSALALAHHRQYDALSLLTRLECRTFWERLILPLAAAAWTVMHTVSLTNEDSRTNIAAANGQFFLIRRSAYESIGGHEAVRDQLTEDVELMRLLKGHGFRTRLFLGSHLASTRMHATLRELFHGWARIYSGTNRRNPSRIIAAMVFVLICGLSVYPALAYGIFDFKNSGEARWMTASIAHLVLMTAYLATCYRMSGTRIRNSLLFPMGGSMLLAIFGFALGTCRTGRVNWRNTQFTSPTPVR